MPIDPSVWKPGPAQGGSMPDHWLFPHGVATVNKVGLPGHADYWSGESQWAMQLVGDHQEYREKTILWWADPKDLYPSVTD